MDFQSSDIKYFIETARTGNISRAAERIGIQQPSLSQAIKRLESALKVPLFQRSRIGVTLTPAGKRFFLKAEKFLMEWDNIQKEIQARQDEVVGRYTIGVHVSVALYILKDILPELLNKNEGLEIDLIHDLSRNITEGVISKNIDFGIVINPVNHPDLIIKEIGKDIVTLFCAKKSVPIQPEDVDVLICDASLLQSQKILSELKKAKIAPKRIIRSSSLEVVAQQVATGVGIGILPTRVAENFGMDKLKLLPGATPKFHDRICLIRRYDQPKTLAFEVINKAISGKMA